MLQLNTASLTQGELFPVSFESVNIHQQYGSTTVQVRSNSNQKVAYRRLHTPRIVFSPHHYSFVQ
jgi:hypothetical protein